MDPLQQQPEAPMMPEMPQPEMPESTMAPVAPSPDEAGMSPTVSDDERQQLMDLIGAIEGNLGKLNTAKFTTGNAAEAAKSDAIRQVFSILQSAGIDLTDPEAVAQFLQRMKELNPEIGALLEESLNSLFGVEQEEPEMDPNYETLPEDVREPVPGGPENSFPQ